MGDASTRQPTLLEALLKPVESKLAEEFKTVLEELASLTHYMNTSRDVLEFTVRLTPSSRDAPQPSLWTSRSPCNMISGRYEPDTREMIIYVDRLLMDQEWFNLENKARMTLWYLLIRHLQHTAPHLTISGLVTESADKPTAWEVEACVLSTMLSNTGYYRLITTGHRIVYTRSFPLLELYTESPLKSERTPLFHRVNQLAGTLSRDIEKLRYFIAGKPVSRKLANDIGLEWTLYVKTLMFCNNAVILENVGGAISLVYSNTTYEYYCNDVEIVLEEPVEVNTALLEEIILHPGGAEPIVEFISGGEAVRVKASVRQGYGDEEPLVFSNLGEALAKISEAKIPVKLPKPVCRNLGMWDRLSYPLPRLIVYGEVYRLASISLLLSPGSCPDYNAEGSP
ncbi:hypothetical protein IMZ38_01685 [Thermosphaera chiliense]|uniref:Uncharacterized protein n=1 Tax=Thermosphaera chiliense TaxID=3402707 RepID=A0A7M1UT25_9CREN|nr:hypothetical protein [Thermosphaera aggregans]QOR94673.1 hypothetical protein IMZ38_01685 [Thermosphaera aggregans]